MQEINGFPDYHVTEDGRVYSTKYNKLRELKQQLHAEGRYKFVTLRNGQYKKHKDIHRLVAEAFIPNPDNLPQVNHIDEDKLNNHVDNLEWVTASQNQRHSGHQRAKSYIIENKNGERFEVFNLNKWCRETNNHSGNISRSFTTGWRSNGYLCVGIKE